MRTKKQQLRSKADKLYFKVCLKPDCEICGIMSAKQVHHFFPKGQFGHLRYNIDNGISLCMGCHFRLHHQDPTIQQAIIDIRGKDWYEKLRDISRETPASYQTISYYKQVINELKKYE